VKRIPTAASAARTAAFGLLLLGLIACARQEPGTHHLGAHHDLRFLRGLTVGDSPVVAVPGARWGGNAEGGKWTFKGIARIYCVVRQDVEESLAFHFTPDELTTEFWFTASWNGQPIFDEPQRPGLGDNQVTIPAPLVTPGLHVLTVERIDRLTPDGLRDEKSNRFDRLGYSLGGRQHEIELGLIRQYRHAGMLVARGVTGIGNQKMTGCLFEGPRTAVAEIQLEHAGLVSFVVENGSGSPATFSLRLDDSSVSATVKATATARLELAAEPGRRRLEMTVDGDPGGLFLWGVPRLMGAAAGDRPPIVIVTLDTTRRDALSPWGGPEAASPNLERVAGHATVYDNAWAVSPWTLPSHASIFTGLYPYRHGAGVSEDHLPGRFETLAELLSDSGYLTAGFAGGAMSASTFGVAQGFDHYLDPDGFESRGDVLVDAVEGLLSTWSTEPFHLFVNFFDPHALYDAPAEYERLFRVEELAKPVRQMPVWRGLTEGRTEAWGRLIVGEGEVTPAALEYLRADYLAEVAFMDAQIGRLLEALDRRGLYDPALIVFVADHGELLGEGGLFSHCCRLDPELVWVPMMIKWPHQDEPRRVGELVSHVDIFVTALEAAGIDGPSRDGLPLGRADLEHLRRRRDVFMEEHESRIHPLFENMMLARHMYGIQQLRWREVVWEGGMLCQEEEGGWHDAGCSADWAERLSWLGSLVDLPQDEGVSHSADTLSDDERAKLKALGYVQ
jgi:arylsulfatase A-like enzyme